jgi:hypothetical protein
MHGIFLLEKGTFIPVSARVIHSTTNAWDMKESIEH